MSSESAPSTYCVAIHGTIIPAVRPALLDLVESAHAWYAAISAPQCPRNTSRLAYAYAQAQQRLDAHAVATPEDERELAQLLATLVVRDDGCLSFIFPDVAVHNPDRLLPILTYVLPVGAQIVFTPSESTSQPPLIYTIHR